MNELQESARIALTECLNLSRRETLLVVCDDPCRDIGRVLFEEGAKRSREAVLVQITPRKENGNEPPPPTGEWFSAFDVAVMPTSRSLSHTRARRNACGKGTRIATLPGITADSFARTMRTDWKRLGTRTRTVAARLSAAKTVRITTEAGTDLTFNTGGRRAQSDDGRLDGKGAFGNLPAGEAYCAPLEGSAGGMLVIDGSFPLCGLMQQPLVLEIDGGLVRKIHPHACERMLEQLFVKHGRDGRNVAEFGVGTLDTARITGNILEDEKVKGTIHIALGDNASMGGAVQVSMHLDGIVREPTVYLDGAMWMKQGTLV